jgi:hypothetical protein
MNNYTEKFSNNLIPGLEDESEIITAFNNNFSLNFNQDYLNESFDILKVFFLTPSKKSEKISNNNANKYLNENTAITAEKTGVNYQEIKINIEIKTNMNNPNPIILNDISKGEKEYLRKKRSVSDNEIKKGRNILLNSIFRFVNKKIRIIFNNDIGKGISIKQFVKISKKELNHSNVEFDKNYLNTKLKEIFSGDISGKFTNFLINKNEKLLQNLIKIDYFKELFELTFLQCIEHINGTKFIPLLEGFETLDEILLNEEEKLKENDIENYKYIIENYKQCVENKFSRKPRA